MKRNLLLVSVFCLILVSSSYGEEKNLTGGVFLGGRVINLDRHSAKFNEYNGITPGLFGGADAAYDTDLYRLQADGAYLGDDDFYVRLNGQKWGTAKFSLYYVEFPHNVSFRDRTFYVNPGSKNLNFPGSGSAAGVTDLSRWTSEFGYQFQRREAGGALDFGVSQPFFVSVDASWLQKEGQIPWAGTSGQATFKFAELPRPIDWQTTNMNATVGWKTRQYYAALGAGFSVFTNDTEFVRFRDPFTTAAGAVSVGETVGAPDNKSWNVKLTGTARLPLGSTFALTGSYQKNTSETRILRVIDSAAGPVSLTVNRPTFHGDIEYWNVGAALTSNPWKALETKLYFKYLDKKNNNDGIIFSTPLIAGTTPVETEIFGFQKTSVGAEASYRFLKNLKGIVGYDFTDTRRRDQEFEAGETTGEEGVGGFHGNEAQIPDTWSHTISGQLVYNPLDWLGGRLKYQKLYRNARFRMNPVDTTPGLLGNAQNTQSNAILENNFRRFDINNKEQDMIKVMADVSPLEKLSATIEYAHKYDSYYKSVLGYQRTYSHEFVFDTSYEWRVFKLFGFFDFDTSTTKQLNRYVNVTTAVAPANPLPNANPSGPSNVNSFNWTAKLDNKNYAYGIGTEIPIVKEKVALTVQYDFEKNNGLADFTSENFTAAQIALGTINNNSIDIAQWDDYRRTSISARVKYDFSKDLSFLLGYVYSQFQYTDAQLNGYVLVPTGQNALLSGAYADQSYKANIFYLKTIYRF